MGCMTASRVGAGATADIAAELTTCPETADSPSDEDRAGIVQVTRKALEDFLSDANSATAQESVPDTITTGERHADPDQH